MKFDGQTTPPRLIQGGRTARRPRRPRRPSAGPSRNGATFMQRLEERWQRRRNQNGM